jgi:hypothetical protein
MYVSAATLAMPAVHHRNEPGTRAAAHGFVRWHGRLDHQPSDSSTTATPWPLPMHIVASPYRFLSLLAAIAAIASLVTFEASQLASVHRR